MRMKGRDGTQVGGFTLVELLTVIAIIGILSAILIPTVSSVRTSAKKARTRVQFNQWAAAIESFKTEYGYYPLFDASHLVNGGAATTDHLFHDILAARRRDGSALPSGNAAVAQNRKLISFHHFSEPEFTNSETTTPNLLCDAFANTEIAVLMDRDLNGVITASDCGGSFPAVAGIRPGTTDFPPAGVRAGVIFYAPAPDATSDDPRFILSWK